MKGLKPVIGLCGGIGAGKSAVADLLAAQGAAVIDSDALAHQALDDPEVTRVLREWWGAAAFGADGRVDRAAVAAIVFNAERENERLKGLIYPWIAARRRERLGVLQAAANVRLIVLNSPLLYEAGLDAECDAVVFVDASREARLARLRASRGWSADELDRRERLQAPLDAKKARADYVLANDSSLDELRLRTTDVYSRLLTDLGNA